MEEAKKTYNIGEKKEPEEVNNVQWYRKSINTRLSKLKNGQGKRETHIAEIKRLLVNLSRISAKDALEMSQKVAKET